MLVLRSDAHVVDDGSIRISATLENRGETTAHFTESDGVVFQFDVYHNGELIARLRAAPGEVAHKEIVPGESLRGAVIWASKQRLRDSSPHLVEDHNSGPDGFPEGSPYEEPPMFPSEVDTATIRTVVDGQTTHRGTLVDGCTVAPPDE